MTDNEIIKALECCIGRVTAARRNCGNYDDFLYCIECPLHFTGGCSDEVKRVALDLINSQKAEIESEVLLRQQWQEKCNELLEERQHIKAEAVKEFAERLKDTIEDYEYVIDRLVKEMIGEK